jgi:hypothetical protein
MKLTSYVLGLLIAVAAGVMPASAQVTFKLTPVGNDCSDFMWDIILQPGQIYLKDGSGKVLSGTFDSLKQPTFRSTYSAGKLKVNMGSSCRFHSCGINRTVSLNCWGPYGNQHGWFTKQ